MTSAIRFVAFLGVGVGSFVYSSLDVGGSQTLFMVLGILFSTLALFSAWDVKGQTGPGLKATELMEALERLGRLRESGVVTEEEFEKNKRRLLRPS